MAEKMKDSNMLMVCHAAILEDIERKYANLSDKSDPIFFKMTVDITLANGEVLSSRVRAALPDGQKPNT